MAHVFAIHSLNSQTTVVRIEKTIAADGLPVRWRTEINAETNTVIANWQQHNILPSAASDDVDAAFVWASVFDHKLLAPLSVLVKDTGAFSTALVGGVSYASMSDLIKCVPLDTLDDEVIFYAFRSSLQNGHKTWAKKLGQILVVRDSNCLGEEFADFMRHSTNAMLRAPDVMRMFKHITRARSTLWGLGVIHNYPPFLKWYRNSAADLVQRPQRENLHGWDEHKVYEWACAVYAQQQHTTLLDAVPKKRSQSKLKM